MVTTSAWSAGCAEPFPDQTAEVDIDGRRLVFALDACGLDGDTVLLLGRSDDDVLQVVVGVTPRGDALVADPAATGVTVGETTDDWAAFGPDSWILRGGDGDPPGSIVSVVVDGSRVAVEAVAVAVDGTTVLDGPTVDLSVEARCDADVTT